MNFQNVEIDFRQRIMLKPDIPRLSFMAEAWAEQLLALPLKEIWRITGNLYASSNVFSSPLRTSS